MNMKGSKSVNRSAITKVQGVALIAIIAIAVIAVAYYVFMQGEVEEEITITLVHPGVLEKVTSAWGPLIEEYEEGHPNVKVDLIAVGWGELATKLRTMVGSGNPPDIAFIAGVMMPTYAELEALIPFDEYDWFDDLFASSYASVWPDATYVDNKHYLIPSGCGVFALMYNKEIAEEAGVPTWQRAPEDWSELRMYAQYIRDNTTYTPFAMTAGGGWDPHEIMLHCFMMNTVGELYDGLNGKALFNTSLGDQTFEWYIDLYKDGLTQDNPWEFTRGDVRPLFRDGKVGMYIEGPYAIPEIDEGMDFFSYDTADDCPAMFAILPQPPVGLQARAYPPDADGLIVFKSSDHVDIAADIVRFANSFEWQKHRSMEYGYTPIYKNTTDDEHFSHWLYKPLYDMLELDTLGKIKSTHFDELYRLLADYTVRAIKGEMTAEEALDNMAYLSNLLHGV
jgi:ABC-type glycerol-3-phosphate transport system substrate-binding protein